jgi:deazaflavin-dependent oxidoreductase (nitroreductase family)
MPSDFSLKVMNAVHRGVLKLTGGRRGWHAMSMPVLELTTVGRKTGQPHSVMLTSPLQDGTALIVVASRGGDDRPPAWFLNLEANSAVEVSTRARRKQPMRARVADPAERLRLWPRVVTDHPMYAEYQTKTTREIPLVFLQLT